jgi:excisionase family DNA binding protein
MFPTTEGGGIEVIDEAEGAGSARLYDVPTAATRLGIGKSMAWELIRRGELGSVQIRRRRLVPGEAIDAFIKKLIEREAS